ncbi:hypothetical protein ACIBG7_12795 [Nonomuraea sp. NPDC050328]
MTIFPTDGGLLVVPAVLPIHVPNSALGITVAEWLLLDPAQEVTNV